MKCNNEKVSVVVPIYNMENSIYRCVESIENQSYKNIEIILVDDGSKDKSVEVCKKIENKFDNVKTIFKENGGVSTARNVGLKSSTGDWIMFVDPDDFLNENIIEKLINKCDKNVDISMCTCTAIDSYGEHICHFFKGDRIFENFEQKKDLYKQLMKMDYAQVGDKIYTAIGVPWGKLYNLKMIRQFNLSFDEDLRRVQDNIFNIEAFSNAKKISYIDEPLYMYNFEHMESFFKKYKKNYAEIFTAVRKAKYNCMKKYNLMDDEELYKFYVNEAIIGEANIMKQGIFNKDNSDSLGIKIKKAKELSNNECFNSFMNINGLKTIGTLKYKLYWLMLKLRLFYLIYLISQI